MNDAVISASPEVISSFSPHGTG